MHISPVCILYSSSTSCLADLMRIHIIKKYNKVYQFKLCSFTIHFLYGTNLSRIMTRVVFFCVTIKNILNDMAGSSFCNLITVWIKDLPFFRFRSWKLSFIILCRVIIKIRLIKCILQWHILDKTNLTTHTNAKFWRILCSLWMCIPFLCCCFFLIQWYVFPMISILPLWNSEFVNDSP